MASVKPSSPDAQGQSYTFTPGGGLNIRNGTLKGIVEMAYEVRDFQISGGPGWIESDRYNIDAKSTYGDQPAAMSLERIKEIRVKLQALIADRFHLQVHRDTKELPIFTLGLGKNGAKLTESQGDKPQYGIRGACGQLTGMGATMAIVANSLARQLGRPVRDLTGLTGKYDFRVEWTPDAGPCPDAPETAADGPSLFAAMQQQLGLKLESTKGPVEIIVIDHAEKPEGN